LLRHINDRVEGSIGLQEKEKEKIKIKWKGEINKRREEEKTPKKHSNSCTHSSRCS
jgi:hypothetical protein